MQAALSVLSHSSHEVPFPEFAGDPVGFSYQVLGVKYLTPEQAAISLSVRDRAITNVPAGNGVGKDFLAAQLVLWFVFAVGGRVFTTAPTEGQVKDILWHEIRLSYARNRAKLGGECLELRLRLSEAAGAIGFTASNYNSDAFQGKHGEKLLLILDEANGISREIDDGALSCVVGSENRLLRIGNPTASGTPFEAACGHSSIRVPVWTHPNVSWAYRPDPETGVQRLKPEVAQQLLKPDTAFDGITYRDARGDSIDDPVLPQQLWPETLPLDVIPGAVSVNWIERIRGTKGEGSSFWSSRCDAWFPTDSNNSIVPRSSWLAARARYDANPDYWDSLARHAHWRHGLDVGDGGDPHALASWRGPVLYSLDEAPTLGDREDVGRASDLAVATLRRQPGSIAVDQIGVGAGALSNILGELRDARNSHWANRCRASGCNFALRGQNKGVPDRFLSMRVYQYWLLREALETNDYACAPLGALEDKMFSGFGRITYFEDAGGKIRLLDKVILKKITHLGRSPDIEDAAVMGFNAPRVVLTQSLPHGPVRSSTRVLAAAP